MGFFTSIVSTYMNDRFEKGQAMTKYRQKSTRRWSFFLFLSFFFLGETISLGCLVSGLQHLAMGWAPEKGKEIGRENNRSPVIDRRSSHHRIDSHGSGRGVTTLRFVFYTPEIDLLYYLGTVPLH
jgi:hypothetical protein